MKEENMKETCATIYSLAETARTRLPLHSTVALWPFRSIAQEFKLPVSTVFSICAQPNTPQATRAGQPHILSRAQQENLIHYATASQTNRHKSFSTIVEEIGIHAHERTLPQFFASRGYHRRIARVKPFLTTKAKLTRLQFAQDYHDWTVADWQKVIWTDKCAFNIGGFCGKLGLLGLLERSTRRTVFFLNLANLKQFWFGEVYTGITKAL